MQSITDFSTGILFLYFSLLFQVFLSSSISAQSRIEEVIYLKNGSVVRGTIVEQVPGQSVKIQTEGGNLFVYQMDEIEKITKEAGRSSNSGLEHSIGQLAADFDAGKLSHHIEMGSYLADLEYGFFFQYNLNYHLIPRVSAGLGIGGNYDTWEEATLPIFLDLRAYLLKGRTTPYLNLQVGTAPSLSGGDASGYLNIAPGIRYQYNPKTAMTVDIGYRKLHDLGYFSLKAGWNF